MAFDDLNETLEEQDRDDQEMTEKSGESVTAVEETTTRSTQDDVVNEQRDEEPALTDPAFSFDETKQDAIYARPDAWEIFDDMLDLDLERELRDRGVREVSKREKHDAVLRVVADHAKEVADQIEGERHDAR